MATINNATVKMIINSSYVLIKHHPFRTSSKQVEARPSATRINILWHNYSPFYFARQRLSKICSIFVSLMISCLQRARARDHSQALVISLYFTSSITYSQKYCKPSFSLRSHPLLPAADRSRQGPRPSRRSWYHLL